MPTCLARDNPTADETDHPLIPAILRKIVDRHIAVVPCQGKRHLCHVLGTDLAPVPGSWHRRAAGGCRRRCGERCDQARRQHITEEGQDADVRLTGCPLTICLAHRRFNPCQKPGTGARLRCQLVWHGTAVPCQRKCQAARFLSGACQGCQILVRKNRVRAGQGRPKPQQVEPADRNPDKKRGTPTPGSVPETCQERRASHASRASHAMRGPPPGPTAAGPGEEGNPHDRPPTG